MRSVSTSLQIRLALVFALLTVILTIALTAAIGMRANRLVREKIGQSLTEIAHEIADKLDRGMWARSGEVAVLTELDVLRAPKDPAAIQTILDRLQRAIPGFSWAGLIDPHGKVVAATRGMLVGADASKLPVFVEGSKGTFVGDARDAFMLAELLPNPKGISTRFVNISMPVRDSDGKLSGILVTHLDWAWAGEPEHSILEPLRKRKGIDLFVVARDDTILLGPDRNIGEKLALGVMAGARAGTNGWAVETWPDGHAYLTGAALGRGHESYPDLGWTVLARQRVETAYEPIAELQGDILAWGLALAVVFAALGWYLASLVAKPLAEIAAAADDLRTGKSAEIPEYEGIRDIEILSSSLRLLIANLMRSEAARDTMEKLAHRDRLTGLANRIALDEHLEKAIALARRKNSGVTLLYLDLDGFKAVNDTFGHEAGDELLKVVAQRLKGCLRTGDLVARMGGDEFVMVMATSTDHARLEAEAVAERVIAAVNAPVSLDGRETRVGCSIGGAYWPMHGSDVRAVLLLAGKSLYAAKNSGRNRLVFHVPSPEEKASTGENASA